MSTNPGIRLPWEQPAFEGFADRPVVQLEFEVKLPWNLSEPEPD